MARQRFQAKTGRGIGQQIPWWGISLVLHLAVLFAMSMVEFTVPQRQKKIQVKTEFVEVVERLRAVKKRDVFSKAAQQAANRGAVTSLSAQVASLSKNVKTLQVSAGDIGATINDLLGKGSIDSLDKLGQGGGDLAEVQSKAPQTYDEVLDEFASDVIDGVAKKRRRLLVVLLVDESKSIFDDRQAISNKIDKIGKTLKTQMSEAEHKRLKWGIVSFGQHARTRMTASTDLQKIKHRIMNIKFDESGKENLFAAIQFTMKHFCNPKKYRLFLAVVSDEPGDDTRGQKGAEQLLAIAKQLKATNTRLYVFGREANFSYPRVWTAVYDMDGRVIDYNWADGGPETPERELLPHTWRLNSNAAWIPSGYGMYAQTYLARETGGTYFIMSDVPSRYDDDKLDKDYAPEVVPLREYLRRREGSSIRKKLHFICEEWRRSHLLTIAYARLDRLNEDARAQILKAQKAHQWVQEARRALEKTKKRDKYRPKRWEANRDLTIAQLAKIQFHYRQYWIALSKVFKKGWPYPTKGERYNRFYVTWDAPTDKPPGGRAARSEMRRAQQLLKKVVEEHEGTPWAELASRDLKYLRPFKLVFAFYERTHARPPV